MTKSDGKGKNQFALIALVVIVAVVALVVLLGNSGSKVKNVPMTDSDKENMVGNAIRTCPEPECYPLCLDICSKYNYDSNCVNTCLRMCGCG